ncbi:asparagine synthase-related protein [Corynebacterium hiratae]|uniref:Uncharacterized protein n=1 Tax=Corynebacterium aurimucosum TaxID=169292 RepID=A0A6I3K9I4_9CORY|nr:asparagine synthase-related protein [Corynebacterium aurimucosum]MTD90643.1 hypothetical protein [Corynebacterium aurimucosum]
MLNLTIIPRNWQNDNSEEIEHKLDTVLPEISKYLGKRYLAKAQAVRNLGMGGTTSVIWQSQSQAKKPCFALKKGRWAFATSPLHSASLIEAISTRAGDLRFEQPVWGSYAAIMGDKNTNRVFAWNTVPALEAIHYGQDAHFTYISNRPLFIALAMSDGDSSRVQLDENYAYEYLNFGYSVSGVTPFRGVKTLAPRSSLRVVGGAIRIGAAPQQAEICLEEKDNRWFTGADELSQAFLNATERALDRRGTDHVQLRLSGGLDSRIILGLFRDRPEVEVTAVTQGEATSEEVMVAAQLAEVAGVKHRAVIPGANVPSSFVDSMLKSIADSQGFIPSEALVAPYENASPIEIGENLVAGQWPLFKGVLDKTNANSLEYVYRRFGKTNAKLLNPELNQYSFEVFDNWLASVSATTNLELLYMHGRDLRSSRYLQPHVVQADAESQVMYPFCDSEVVAVADVLPALNRMQNVSAFLAVSNIWEDALKVPTARGGAFKFEASAPLEGVSGQFYELRKQAPKPFHNEVHKLSNDGPDFINFFLTPITSAAKFLVSSDRWAVLASILDSEFVDKIVKLSACSEEEAVAMHPARAPRKILTIRLLRTLLVERWLSKEWLVS